MSGAAGGILVMWYTRFLSKLDSMFGSSLVSVVLKMNDIDNYWLFSGVYGSCSDGDRRLLWEDLLAVKDRWDGPWCIGGDFNVVRFPHERSSSRVYSQAMVEFNDFINTAELVDLPLTGGDFTWFRGGDGNQHSRIDSFLVSADWEDHFNSLVFPKLLQITSPCFLIVEGFRRENHCFVSRICGLKNRVSRSGLKLNGTLLCWKVTRVSN